jgi:hypothetical protein
MQFIFDLHYGVAVTLGVGVTTAGQAKTLFGDE